MTVFHFPSPPTRRPDSDVVLRAPCSVTNLAEVRRRRVAQAPSPEASVWLIEAANTRGEEDGRVHVTVRRGDVELRTDLTPDRAHDLLRVLGQITRIAERRRRGGVELRLYRRDGHPVSPPRAMEGEVIDANADALCVRTPNGSHWYVVATGEPLHRDRRAGYWRLSEQDLRHFARARQGRGA